MAGQFRPAHSYPDAVVALGQRTDHASPQKTRSPEDGDQRVQIRCHGASIPRVKFIRSWKYLAISRYANTLMVYSAFASRLVNLTTARAIRTNPPGPRWRNW